MTGVLGRDDLAALARTSKAIRAEVITHPVNAELFAAGRRLVRAKDEQHHHIALLRAKMQSLRSRIEDIDNSTGNDYVFNGSPDDLSSRVALESELNQLRNQKDLAKDELRYEHRDFESLLMADARRFGRTAASPKEGREASEAVWAFADVFVQMLAPSDVPVKARLLQAQECISALRPNLEALTSRGVDANQLVKSALCAAVLKYPDADALQAGLIEMAAGGPPESLQCFLGFVKNALPPSSEDVAAARTAVHQLIDELVSLLTESDGDAETRTGKANKNIASMKSYAQTMMLVDMSLESLLLTRLRIALAASQPHARLAEMRGALAAIMDHAPSANLRYLVDEMRHMLDVIEFED